MNLALFGNDAVCSDYHSGGVVYRVFARPPMPLGFRWLGFSAG